MNLARLREICLALPGATEQIQWGDNLVFKVGGKMFCVSCTEPRADAVAMSFKCDPETFGELIERPGVIPAPYLARAKWVGLERFDALPDGETATLVTRSHGLVVDSLPKKLRERLSAAAASRPRQAKKRSMSSSVAVTGAAGKAARKRRP